MNTATTPVIPTIKNEQTGSTFYTLGRTDDGILGSLRVWTEQVQANKHSTALMFRFRVEQADDAVQALNIQQLMNTTFPLAKWAGKSSKHCSVMGSMHIERPIWDTDGILSIITSNHVVNHLWAILQKDFQAINYVQTEDQFVEFVTGLITDVLTTGQGDSPIEKPGVLLSFGQYKGKFVGGELAGQSQAQIPSASSTVVDDDPEPGNDNDPSEPEAEDPVPDEAQDKASQAAGLAAAGL